MLVSSSMDTSVNEDLAKFCGENVNMYNNSQVLRSQNTSEEIMESVSINDVNNISENASFIEPTMKQTKVRKITDDYQPAKKPMRTYIAKNIVKSMTEIKEIPTSNMFQVLTTAPSVVPQTTISVAKTSTTNTGIINQNVSPTMSTAASSNKTTQGKIKKPPPIILVSKVNYFELRKQIKKLIREDITAQYCPQGIKMYASNDSDYSNIGHYLKAQKYEFYTFPHGQPKVHKVVLKGLPIDTPTEDIQEELVSLHYPVESIKQMKRKQIDEASNKIVFVPIPMWIVTTYVTQTAPDIHNLTGLFNLKLKIEDYKSKEGPLQCYKCQGFGHKAISCYVTPKCVKCAKEHLTQDCTSDDTLIPKCANCNEEHTANYKQCPKYVKYINGVRNNRAQSRNTGFSVNQQNFPSLPERNLGERNLNSENTSENITSVFQDLKELWSYFKNIKIYLNKFKTVMHKIRQEGNLMSKIGTLLECMTEMFDSTTDHGNSV